MANIMSTETYVRWPPVWRLGSRGLRQIKAGTARITVSVAVLGTEVNTPAQLPAKHSQCLLPMSGRPWPDGCMTAGPVTLSLCCCRQAAASTGQRGLPCNIAPWEARTPDLEVNSLTLWPAELRKLMCSGQQRVRLDICLMATSVATGVQGLVPDQGWDSQNHRLCTSPWH